MRRGIRAALRRNLALKLVSLALAVVLYLLLRSTAAKLPQGAQAVRPPAPADVAPSR